ncbi:MAG: ATP-binding domain-containing protein, partial [Bacillota bacterium]
RDIAAFQEEGFETIAVIGKTFADCQKIYKKLHQKIKVSLVHPREGEMEKGVLIIPAYGAKGLEFDCALIHGADAQNYQSELDKRLLYIACTRALHRLQLYAVGEKSPFLWFSAH